MMIIPTLLEVPCFGNATFDGQDTTFNGLTNFNGDATFSGKAVFNGETTYQNVSTLDVSDNFISLAYGNETDSFTNRFLRGIQR